MRHTVIRFIFAISLLLGGMLTFAQEATPEPAVTATEEVESASTDSLGADSGGGLVTGLRHLHAWTRWLVVLVTIAALVKLGMGFIQNADYDLFAYRLMIGFSGLVTIQWLIGLIFFVALGAFNVRYRWEHALVMTVAVGISHMHMRWKNADANTRYRNSLLIVVAVLILVVVGVALLPQGWRVAPSI